LPTGSVKGEFLSAIAATAEFRFSIRTGIFSNRGSNSADQAESSSIETTSYRNDIIYVTDNESDAKVNPGVQRGVRIASAKDGAVKALIPGLGRNPESQSVGGGVAVDALGNVYWSETNGMIIKKFTKK
jgi:hypothetical protein